MNLFSKLRLSILSISLLVSYDLVAQVEAVIPPSNRSTASMEKNLLYYADQRYIVSQSGSTSLPLAPLFNGNLTPYYSGPVDPANPYVILIENLPGVHVQASAWIGWTTRYYNPVKFKIEVYNIYQGAAEWVTVADEDDYGGGSYIKQVIGVAVGKIRFTFYKGGGPSYSVGLSELFFIHPEATTAYDGLMVKLNAEGNVGIGTGSPTEKLSVNGNIRAREIKVETSNWPDYVFDDGYELMSLNDLEQYVKKEKHFPSVPSAKQIEEGGHELGKMNAILLKNQEDLLLYLFDQNKRIKKLEKEIEDLKAH